MPSIAPGDKVLVTGASGYIAAHLCALLLANGHPVRGTVRYNEKGEFLKKLFEGVGDFEYVVVKDIENSDSFDDAVKGIPGIAHTASPFHFNADDPQELIGPAVAGTLGVLKSALAHDPELKRIVVTSSVASIMHPNPPGAKHASGPPYTYDEEDWNTYSPEVIEKEGRNAPAPDKYRASKSLAEQAAWKFHKENHPSWDIATINPPLVLGPIIHQCDSPDALNTSVAQFYQFMLGNKTDADLESATGNWIDVRDVALAHYKALTSDAASNQRFVVSAGPFCGQDIVDVLHTFPEDPIKGKLIGHPGKGKEYNAKANVHSGKKTHEVLGINYTPLNVTVEDMYKSLKERFGK